MYYKLAYPNKYPAPSYLLVALGATFVLLALVIGGRYKSSPVIVPSQTASVTRYNVGSVTNTSISLYFRTVTPSIPSVWYSTDPEKNFQKVYDVRDTENSQVSRRNHVITLHSLIPSTTYYFKIDQGASFDVKTASRTSTTSSHPIYGKLINTSKQPIEGGVLLITFKNAYPLITLSKNDGTFLISTCCVIDAQTLDTKTIRDNDPVTAEIIDEDGNQLIKKDFVSAMSPFSSPITITHGSKTIDNQTPHNVPVVKIKKEVLGATDHQISSPDTFSVFYPIENSIIPLPAPLLKGSGVPGKTVRLSLKKLKIATSTSVNSKGLWDAQFTSKLPAGAYELIANSNDKQGKSVSINRIFNVAKSGEQVLGSATNSATLTPRPTDSIEITTPTPTLAETDFSTPVPPVAGGFNMPLIVISSLALIVIGAGIILIF